MTQQYTLRAMALNYQYGHSWDHLDGDVVTKAADEIESLQAELDEAMLLLVKAQVVIRMYKRKM